MGGLVLSNFELVSVKASTVPMKSQVVVMRGSK